MSSLIRFAARKKPNGIFKGPGLSPHLAPHAEYLKHRDFVTKPEGVHFSSVSRRETARRTERVCVCSQPGGKEDWSLDTPPRSAGPPSAPGTRETHCNHIVHVQKHGQTPHQSFSAVIRGALTTKETHRISMIMEPCEMKFTERYSRDSVNVWEKVLWSDETKLQPENTIPIVKHGGGNTTKCEGTEKGKLKRKLGVNP